MIFCTLFDSHYIAQGLTMLYSLLNVNSKCFIYVAAMDENCYNLLEKTVIERVNIINIKEIINRDYVPI